MLIPLLLVGLSVERSPNFVVFAHDENLAARVAYDAEAHRKRFGELILRRELSDWTYPRLIFVRKQKSWENENGYARQIGEHYPYIELIGSDPNYPEIILSHEICHLMIFEEEGDFGARWFSEGLSVYFETFDRGYPVRLHEHIETLTFAELLDTSAIPFDVDGDGFYGQAYSLTRYLIETYGMDSAWEFHREGLKLGWEFAALRVLCITLDQLEQQWKASLSSMTSPYPRSLRGK